MKLLLLFIGFILYGRAGTVAADSMIEAPKPETGSPGDVDEIQVAQPPPLVFKGAEDFVAVPATKRFNRTDKAKKQGVEAVNTVNVKTGKPQILPMPIAVGEPSPQKPIVFTLDGYLYEGAQKIASYRIDFRGVHFKDDKLTGYTKDENIDEYTVTEGPLKDGEKATTAMQGEGKVNGATTEAKTPADSGSATTEAVYPVTDNVNEATTEAQTPEDVGMLPEVTTKRAMDNSNGATTKEQSPVDGAADTTVTVGPSGITKPWAVDEEATTPQAVESKEKKTTKGDAGVASTAAPIAAEAVASTNLPADKTEAPTAGSPTGASVDPEDALSTKAPVAPEAAASTKAPIAPEAIGSTNAPVDPEPSASTKAPVAPEAAASTAAPTPEADASTKARVPRESDASTSAPVAPKEGASSTVAAPVKDVLFTGVPPKPEIWQDKEGKCTEALTFAFDAKAGRCLANKTYACKEEEWAAVLKKTFGECMKSAPKVAPADNNVKSDCGLGKVYAKVPGEPSADLYGKLCKYEFCPKEATCVQDKTAAHCCIMPMWAHYG